MVHLVRAEILRKNGRGFSLESPRCTTRWQLRLRHDERAIDEQPANLVLVSVFLEGCADLL